MQMLLLTSLLDFTCKFSSLFFECNILISTAPVKHFYRKYCADLLAKIGGSILNFFILLNCKPQLISNFWRMIAGDFVFPVSWCHKNLPFLFFAHKKKCRFNGNYLTNDKNVQGSNFFLGLVLKIYFARYSLILLLETWAVMPLVKINKLSNPLTLERDSYWINRLMA